ncbi:MAG TPA: methyltransferase domain-containing protein, partial [Solirubrobacteraceae bacterium]
MDRDYELQTHQAEDRHWWYRGRRNVLERVIADLHLPARARILDAGCGSGRNMVELARHGTVTGVELSEASVRLARERGAGEVVEGSVLEMPFEADSFEMAASLDVIEHLEDDLAALRELRRVVAPGGSLLVTVPAYQWLWSGHDEINHHFRRYTRRSLQRAGEEAGWQQVRTTYFNSLLLPAAILLRVLDRFSRKTTESSLDLWVPPEPMNWLLERPLQLEATLIGH